jgi:CobQ-like glutamine amidotransferase family enzyme
MNKIFIKMEREEIEKKKSIFENHKGTTFHLSHCSRGNCSITREVKSFMASLGQ